MTCIYCGGELEAVEVISSDSFPKMKLKPMGTMLCCKRCHAARPYGIKEVFYVHAPGRSEPKVGHDTLEEALAEAERVARLNGTEVRVYKQVAVVRPTCCTETHYGI